MSLFFCPDFFISPFSCCIITTSFELFCPNIVSILSFFFLFLVCLYPNFAHTIIIVFSLKNLGSHFFFLNNYCWFHWSLSYTVLSHHTLLFPCYWCFHCCHVPQCFHALLYTRGCPFKFERGNALTRKLRD